RLALHSRDVRPTDMMRNVCLVVQYDGTQYAGFQAQPDRPTVQCELERALSSLLQQPTRVQGASRTDAGVHAFGQVVTFKTENVIPVERLRGALNGLLPDDIVCVRASEVPADFRPHYTARRKQYSYRILNRELPSPFLARYAWHLRRPLDVEAMSEAGQHLVGAHDFAAFCAAHGSAKTSVREVYALDMLRDAEIVEMRIEGNGFLYMMVRIIMGTLTEVGLGKLAPSRVGEILFSRDRNQAGPTAPPQGLSLVRIDY
ncbi:MAG: tRNA pseudouridine(38-40) synthase TruA, partial [Armatimonadota bacterium]